MASNTTLETAQVGSTPKKKGVNRFDSPWLNPRFLTGVFMIGFVLLAGLLGPLLWDVDLSLVGSAPLNLPPAWVQYPIQTQEAVNLVEVEGANIAATQTAIASASAEAGAGAGSGEVSASATPTSASLTGGLGGSSILGLMTTQTVAPVGATQESAQPQATATPTQGVGGLGGSSILGLMTTQTVAPVGATQAVATAAPTQGAGGLGGSSILGLMTTQTAAPVGATNEPTATSESGSSVIAGADVNFTRSTIRPSGMAAHPLGTDNSGRDLLAVLIVGAPASLRVGFIAATVGMTLGIIFGFAAGFLGGWVDNVIRTASDVAFTIPSLAVLLVISAYLRRVDLDTMALLLALFAWPAPTRLIRAQVLTLRERGYIRMAQLSGMSTFSIMFREMLPNLLPYLAASLAGNISGAILAATSLEALGLGPTRYPTLGTTIFNALRATAILRDMWWWWGFPVLTLMFIFTGLFQLATGLDEIANPRLRGVKQ